MIPGRTANRQHTLLRRWQAPRLPECVIACLLLCALAGTMQSCTTDAYEKGEGEYSHLRADMIDLHVNADKAITYGDTDEDQRLILSKPISGDWITKADTTLRAYIYYNMTADNKADVVSVGSVLVLRPRREEHPKTDPTGLESIWLSTNRRYLNLSLLLKMGTAEQDSLHQTLGATFDTLTVNADNTRTLHLHLYHDQGGIPEYYTQRVFASIPLGGLPADSLHLRVNTYQGWHERTVALR